MGRDVLLLIDSVTRVAGAVCEIGPAVGEPVQSAEVIRPARLLHASLLLKLLVALLAMLAARGWAKVMRARYLARWAFALMLLVPLLRERAEQLKRFLALMFVAVAMLTLAPKLLSLFPGVIHASLTLKALLPEAAAPGWIAATFSPTHGDVGQRDGPAVADRVPDRDGVDRDQDHDPSGDGRKQLQATIGSE